MKTIKNNMIGFIIGGLLFGTVGVSATTYFYQSNQVSYSSSYPEWTVSNVKEAIDDLFVINQKKQTKFDIGVYLRADKNAFSWTYLDCENCKRLKLGTLRCYDKAAAKFMITVKDVTNNQVIQTISNQSENSFNSTYAGTYVDIPEGCKKIEINLGSSLENSDYILFGNELE